jgi:VWFA-related protein
MPRIVSKPQILTQLVFVPFLFQLPARAQAVANPTLVTFDLRAHDRKGEFVTDLTASDVQIVDGGVPVSLKSLRLAPQGPASITFVFDQVVPGVAKTDRDLADEFLTAVSGRGYLFTVLRVEGRLHLVQAPTGDIEAVKNAIAAVTVAKRPDYIKVTEAAEKQMTEDIGGAPAPRQATAKMLMAILEDSQKVVESDARSTPSVAALLAASRGQQEVPGRKTILYFSQGLAWHTNTPESLRDIDLAANRASVSIFSFDAEIGDEKAADALIAGSALGVSQAMGNIPNGPPPPGLSTGAIGPGQITQAWDFTGRMTAGSDNTGNPHSLAAICANTGGMRVGVMGGEIHRDVLEIAAALNSYYLASWISPASGDDNRLRPIDVKSLRKGVLVASRSGYFPMRGSSVERVSAMEGRLLEALAAPRLPGDLPLNAAVVHYGNTPGNELNSVVVQVPADGVEMKGDAGSVSVLAQLKDQSGAVVKKFSADIPRRIAIGSQAPAGPDVISFRRQFSAPPGQYILESAAMDANGGKIGAQRASVVIPPVADGLALGDVLLVRRIDPADTADGTDPLRCAEGVAVPNISGRISKAADGKINLLFYLHTDPGSTDTPSLSAELRRGGDLIGALPLKMPADPNRQTIPYLTTLGAGSLRAGKYEMTVILRQGGHRVSQSVSFTLD